MAITQEAIETVLNFHPKIGSLGYPSVEFGEISKGILLVHDILPYQMRAQILDGEPLVSQWTRQPVLALVEGGKITTLAYATDVIGIGEELAVKVVDHLHVVKARQG